MNQSIFEFDSETTSLIDKLKTNSNSSSRVETLRKALYLLDIVTQAKEDGKRIFIVSNNSKTDREIIV